MIFKYKENVNPATENLLKKENENAVTENLPEQNGIEAEKLHIKE